MKRVQWKHVNILSNRLIYKLAVYCGLVCSPTMHLHYAECSNPKCGKWLAPTAGADTLPDPEGYTLADDQDPFNKRPKTVGEDILIELKRNRGLLTDLYSQCHNCMSGYDHDDLRIKINADIDAAEKALAEQDIIAILTAYEALKGNQ